jgi:hypothetical protein
MPAQVRPARHAINGRGNGIDTDVSESHRKPSVMSLLHLIESDCAAQSGFGGEVLASRDVILNELFTDGSNDRAN